MNPTPNRPFYSHDPIHTLSRLAAALRVEVAELQYLAEHAETLYRPAKPQQKSDGSMRQTYDAKPRLKSMHGRIKSRLLDVVHYPKYLQGSLKGCSPGTNAVQHAQAAIVISEDIKGFFPSTRMDIVYDIWRAFFRFSDEVATCLTRITTRRGGLPEGARTSPHLANLALWRREPVLYEQLTRNGMSYTRYVDDISVSCGRRVSPDEKTRTIAAIYGMLKCTGYDIKRAKHQIVSARDPMLITGLLVNQRPTVLKDERARIRAGVFQLELTVRAGECGPIIVKELNRLTGRVGRVKIHHPAFGKQLGVRLALIRAALKTTGDPRPIEQSAPMPQVHVCATTDPISQFFEADSQSHS